MGGDKAQRVCWGAHYEVRVGAMRGRCGFFEGVLRGKTEGYAGGRDAGGGQRQRYARGRIGGCSRGRCGVRPEGTLGAALGGTVSTKGTLGLTLEEGRTVRAPLHYSTVLYNKAQGER